MRGIEGDFVWVGDAVTPPIEGGAVVLDEHGVVVAVGPVEALRVVHPGARWERHAGVLGPGLVDARVSLELSALRGGLPGGGFGRWLRALGAARAALRPELDAAAIDGAVASLVALGTVAIGEVTATGATVARLAGAPILARVWHEVAGLRRETALTVRAMAEEALAEAHAPNLSAALAPHGLLGLHPDVLADVAAAGAPLRLAWTAAERAFLEHGGGAFAQLLASTGADPADWPPPGLGPVAQARALGALDAGVVPTHLTDARPDEVATLAETSAACVLCPRASLHVEGRLPPLDALLEVGIVPGLGTDSLAASPSLDVLEEVAALRDGFPDVPLATLLSMATEGGARALGLEGRVGRIAVGAQPGVLLHPGAPAVDPLEHVLANAGRPRRVLARGPGRWGGPA